MQNINIFLSLIAAAMSAWARSPLPAQGQCGQYQHLFNHVELLGRGEQTIGVYESTNNDFGVPVVLKYSGGGVVRDYDGYEHTKTLQMNLKEGGVIKALGKLADQGRSKSFPKYYGAFECKHSYFTFDEAGKTLDYHRNRRSTSLFVVMESLKPMEWFDEPSMFQGNQLFPVFKRWTAYLFEALMALRVGQEIGLEMRDINVGSVALYQDPQFEQHRCMMPGMYGFRLPNGKEIYVSKQTTCGKYVKLIDFGMAAVKDGWKRIDTYGPFGSMRASELSSDNEHYDLMKVFFKRAGLTQRKGLDLIMALKKADRETFDLLHDLMKRMLDINFRQCQRRFGDYENLFRVLAVFRDANDGKYVRKHYRLDDVLAHPFFAHVLNDQPRGQEVEYISVTKQTRSRSWF